MDCIILIFVHSRVLSRGSNIIVNLFVAMDIFAVEVVDECYKASGAIWITVVWKVVGLTPTLTGSFDRDLILSL